MPDIKTKSKESQTIKKFDRNAVMGSKLKNNIVDIKDKTKETYEKNENSSQEYAQNQAEKGIKDTTYYGIRTANKIGKKSAKKTFENIKNTKKQKQQWKKQKK